MCDVDEEMEGLQGTALIAIAKHAVLSRLVAAPQIWKQHSHRRLRQIGAPLHVIEFAVTRRCW